ncbi:MAG: zinc-ribbon domain-containing protein [Gammaproteobacteria bacterium]|nr:zinc-ribbon domain-containing protein [Gammaproteobacteria bacterium]MCY4356292.1 zinc-ribbon domain-containing protein [Gammaproteobacteria bacterium]
MAFQITQCPKCGSSFNINAAILSMAEGRVRCGACLAVFNAKDHIVVPNQQDAQLPQESVFIGNKPEVFFNPAAFLAHAAHSETEQTSLPQPRKIKK